MQSRPEDFARALTKAAREIHSKPDLSPTSQAIVETAPRSLPGIEHAGISVEHRDGRIEMMAATDELVWKLDRLQYELNEGPCLDTLRNDPVVLVEDAPRPAMARVHPRGTSPRRPRRAGPAALSR